MGIEAMTAPVIARALDGIVTGRNSVLAPGPGHSRHDRSLAIRIDPTTPEGFLIYSHAGDDWKACRDHVKAVLGLSNQGNSNHLCRNPYAMQSRRHSAELAQKTRVASALWNQTRPLCGTLGEIYLVSRLAGAAIPQCVIDANSIRFHPAPWMGSTGASRDANCAGAVICRMSNPLTGSGTGIHRTFLDPDGMKIDRRMLGRAGVVRLCDPDADGDPMTGLAIGEGLESTLAAMIRYAWAPMWACLNANGIKAFPVLRHVESLTIFADNDIEKAGKRAGNDAALACADRWREAGREVAIITPPVEGSDFADIQGGA